jgi:hypothetical protein
MTSLPLSTTVLQTTKYYKTEEQIQYRVSRLLQWTGQQGEEIEMGMERGESSMNE